MREKGRVICDICKRSTEHEWDIDNKSEEQAWFEELKAKGWTYNETEAEHYCPDCSWGKRIKEIREV